eukprot:11738793-Karenia_brevis.AAC.1
MQNRLEAAFAAATGVDAPSMPAAGSVEKVEQSSLHVANSRPAGSLVQHLATPFTVLPSRQSDAASGGNFFASVGVGSQAAMAPSPVASVPVVNQITTP